MDDAALLLCPELIVREEVAIGGSFRRVEDGANISLSDLDRNARTVAYIPCPIDSAWVTEAGVCEYNLQRWDRACTAIYFRVRLHQDNTRLRKYFTFRNTDAAYASMNRR